MKTTTPSKTEIDQKNRLSEKKIKDHIYNIVSKHLPKEKNKDSMTVASNGEFVLWRPNNYRLKIPIKRKLNSTLKSAVRMQLKKRIKLSNYGSKYSIKNYYSCTISLDKKSMTVIHTPKGRKWYKLYGDVKQMEDYVDNKVIEFEEKCLKAGVLFSRLFKGVSLFVDKRVWIRHEDAVKGEEFIDSIPDDLIMHDTYFKKVYPQEVEFKSPTYMKNYLANRSLEKASPEIISRLDVIERKLDNVETDVLKSLIKFLYPEMFDKSKEVKKEKVDYIG